VAFPANSVSRKHPLSLPLAQVYSGLHDWSPDIVELDHAAIKASWDITSDSLAAWLAKTLSARELILVKSAIIDNGLNLQQLANQDIVDKGFCDFVRQATFKVKVINQQDF
jgi:5-(aminomethyl)-3-furanmethanol phosphate kinase